MREFGDFAAKRVELLARVIAKAHVEPLRTGVELLIGLV